VDLRGSCTPRTVDHMRRRWIGIAVVLAAVPWLVRAQTPTVRVEARGVQPGEIVMLAVTPAAPVTAVAAHAFDRDWPGYRSDDGTWRVLLAVDLDTTPGRHSVTVDAGSTVLTHQLEVEPREFQTRQLTVEPRYVDPPADVLDRIIGEAAMLNAVWESSPAEPLWSGAFRRPVPHRANSAFGSRSVFNGQARSPHGGADFLSPAGTPIEAPNAGRVVVAEDLYYTGQTVAIDHGLGLVSLFAHLSRIDVALGDSVTPGQVVGLVGSTGRVTGPHLHWTLRLNAVRVDPLSLLAVMGE